MPPRRRARSGAGDASTSARGRACSSRLVGGVGRVTRRQRRWRRAGLHDGAGGARDAYEAWPSLSLVRSPRSARARDHDHELRAQLLRARSGGRVRGRYGSPCHGCYVWPWEQADGGLGSLGQLRWSLVCCTAVQNAHSVVRPAWLVMPAAVLPLAGRRLSCPGSSRACLLRHVSLGIHSFLTKLPRNSSAGRAAPAAGVDGAARRLIRT